MLVARATSTPPSSRNGPIQCVLGRGDLVRAVARGQLLDLATDFPIHERGVRIVEALTLPVLGQSARQLILDQSPRAAQLAKAVEIAEHRHVGIGRIVEIRRPSALLVEAVSRRHDGQVRLQENPFRTSPLGRHAQVEPAPGWWRPSTVIAKNESLRFGPGGGKICTDPRPNRARI